MKKEYIKSILDGIIQGVLIWGFPEYIVLVFFFDEPIELNIIFTFILCVLSLISFYFLILQKAEKIWLKSFISFISFVVILILGFINLTKWNINFFPLLDTSNIEGLAVLFLAEFYLVFILISRLVVLAIKIIMKKVFICRGRCPHRPANKQQT